MTDIIIGQNLDLELRLREEQKQKQNKFKQDQLEEKLVNDSPNCANGICAVPKFGPNISNTFKEQNQLSSNLQTNPTNIRAATKDSAWNDAGAINTQNLSADSDSVKLGRDDFKAKEHMLDGQLDNKENSLVKFSHNGKDYLAFRSNNEAYGNYYGFKEMNAKGWQSIKNSPISAEALKGNVDKAHEAKQALIDKFGSYENYKTAQKLQGEFKDLHDMHYDNTGNLKPSLQPNHQEALTKVEKINADIEKIKQGDSNIKISDLEIQYNSIKKDHPELVIDLINNRLNKANDSLGKDELSSIKNKMETDLKSIDPKDKDEINKILTNIEQTIDSKINEKLNSGQELNEAQRTEYKNNHQEVKNLIDKLSSSKYASDQEFQKLQKYFNRENFTEDPNKLKHGKYSLDQLKAFRNHLEKNDWFNKANALDKNRPIQISGKTFQTEKELSAYFKILSRTTGNAILLTEDTESNNKKVFAFQNNQYQEIESQLHEKAKVEAYKINRNSQDLYLMLNPEKNGFWELKLPKYSEGLLTASRYDLLTANISHKADINEMSFNFDLNGNLIGLQATQGRTQGLSYTDEELKAARKNAFLETIH